MDETSWATALQGLVGDDLPALPALEEAVARLRSAGGVPFEVIAGTPRDRYGARITWRAGDPTRAQQLAEAAGLADHPWGAPDWIGVRTTTDGTTHFKPYHRRPPPLGASTVHRGLPVGLEPLMAAQDGSALEVYALQPGQSRWEDFVARALAPLGGPSPDLVFSPVPLPAARGFAVSAQHAVEVLQAVTVFAFPASLPSDEAVASAWTERMSTAELADHEAAVAAAHSLGRRQGRRYGLLAWTFRADGTVVRAASLRLGA